MNILLFINFNYFSNVLLFVAFYSGNNENAIPFTLAPVWI